MKNNKKTNVIIPDANLDQLSVDVLKTLLECSAIQISVNSDYGLRAMNAIRKLRSYNWEISEIYTDTDVLSCSLLTSEVSSKALSEAKRLILGRRA